MCRYYESIQIHSGMQPLTVLTPAHSASFASPMLLLAAATAAAVAFVTAAFNHNYDLTTYSNKSRWKLLLSWPFLLMFSKSFRGQFVSALKGVKVKVTEKPTDAE